MLKLKLFIENFLFYGFGGIISKLIPLIMVPVITRIMPDSNYYGLSDLSNTVVSFGSAFAVLGMYDAMFRMFFEREDEEYKKSVCSTALLFTSVASVVVFIIMLILRKQIAQCFFGNSKYTYIVYLSAVATLVGATNSIVSAPTRMQNKRKVFMAANTIGPIISYTIAIIMLLAGYYTIALPVAAVVSGMIMELSFIILNKRWFSKKYYNKKIIKHLLLIAVPLFPNFLIYWIFNSCDKVMITNLLGIGQAGVYSVSSKLGQCSQLIYMAFAGGWQYFAFSTMKEEKQVENNSKVFEYLGMISYIISLFVFALSSLVFKTLFTHEYYHGYLSAPYLFLAPLLQMLFQVAGNQFIVVKKTWPNMLILSSGAVINIFANMTLIRILGIEGASIATMLGYIVSVIICTVVLIHMNLMVVSKRFILATTIMAVFIIVWRIFIRENTLMGLSLAICVGGIYMMIYRDDLKRLMISLKNNE